MKKPIKSFFTSDKEYVKQLESYIDFLENYEVKTKIIDIDISSIHNTELERPFFYWLKNHKIQWFTNYELTKIRIDENDLVQIKKQWPEIKKC